MPPFSLTQTLLASDPRAHQSATQSPFLALASQGRLPKSLLGQWLANDRLYIHAYIRGIGRLLSFLRLPDVVHPPLLRDDKAEREASVEEKLLHWMIDALVNIRREEDMFVRTAAKYGVDVNLAAGPDGRIAASTKLEGLRRFEALFDGISPPPPRDQGGVVLLPWLEAAVIFWATEKCYLDAWSGAAARQLSDDAAGDDNDADGGALRRELIPNWSSDEFARFVDALGEIVDAGVRREMELKKGEGEEEEVVKARLVERALGKWREVLAAEEAFWPAVEGSD
ncbi:heme oxygenase-like protein [Trichoderma citrinoviride]|uniref:Heme oxygenase-like protein n=1 Tax=Trichoderma citrinoviride TaxID=58853 RepID=A0A2T4BE64_9HYPO|nr:heme oxygenase-like protein [Trichoderma citrinoviride]PTB67614.1 heme oxygenase-like protein [Trichoderma citrinoviride]